jgi:tetratricopeptide (TPR) repeat protein
MNERETNKCYEGQKKIAENTKSLAKHSFLIACIIFFLAITIRFIYLYGSSANPSFQTPIVDSDLYDELARQFANGQGLGRNFFWQSFFYPVFLSVVYFFSGDSIICAKVIQVLLGGLTCALTYRLAEVIFDRRIGIIAGLITVFYGPMVFHESELLATGWAMLWAVVIILLFLKTKEKDKVWLWFFLGLCGILSIITRPEFLPFFLAGCIWLTLKVQRRLALVTRFGAIFAGILLVAMPVGIAAKHAVGKFSILPSSGGLSLYIGNNPDNCQTLTIRPGEEWDELTKLPWQHGVRTIEGQDRFFKQRVIEYVKNQPLDFAKGLGRKTLEFICSREIPRNTNIYMFGKWSPLLSLLTWKIGGFGFPFGLIFPLAVLGVIFNWRRIPLPVILFIVLYPLSIILAFVASRYRVPMVPIFAILAAAGLVGVVKRVRLKQWRQVIITAAVIVGTVLLSSLPGPFCQEQTAFEPEFYNLVGHTLSKRGLNDEAMAYFHEALQLKPDFPEAYYYAGEALMKQNKLSEAAKYYSEAIRLKPDYPLAYVALGSAFLEQGKADEAIKYFEEALRLKPDYPLALVTLGSALLVQGKIDEAIERCEAGLQIEPYFPEAHYYLGVAFDLKGKLDEAIEHYKQALQLKPDFPQAREKLASALARQRQSKNMVQP